MSEPEDPFLWLEDVRGEQALAWVEAENARTLSLLEADPRFARYEAEAREMLNAPDRIPMPRLVGPQIYNLWQDEAHVRGLWRRCALPQFESREPAWETVLDLDALSAAEGANWVWGGANILAPAHRRCLISLSAGGEDAKVVREFDLEAREFVADGFDLPTGKQSVDWLAEDEILLAREWGPGTMTRSGYAFVVKALKRGQALGEAVEVFRGEADDVLAQPTVLRDADGGLAALIVRATDFFRREVYELADGRIRPLRLPAKIHMHALLAGRLVFTVLEDWRGHGAGDLLAASVEDLAGAAPPDAARIGVVFSPGPRQTIEQVATTAGRIVVTVLDNVSSRLFVLEPQAAGRFAARERPVPTLSTAMLVSASDLDDQAYLTVESFVDPTRLIRIDAASDAEVEVRRLPARFESSRLMVEQLEAVSSDGVRIPYFVFRPRDLRPDGANPTILYAYGGFEASLTPAYAATTGRLWVGEGGVYVIANIRGGGEFGPAWHEAGLKTRRQIIYDDFAAVAHDLIARRIASPRRLGIQGGSNGGLLMGVQLNQHPELWRAVAIEVPLLDMLRFEKIGAGASWVGEYGSVEVPEQHAFLERISPYHNLRAGVAYPEPFFVTATSDDRVSPVHARKMAAKMKGMGLPFLFFENTDGGHAASANLNERARRIALEFTYFARKLFD